MSFLKKNSSEAELRPIFILIKTYPGYEHEVYHKLEKVEELSGLYPLFGEYDYLVKFSAEVNIRDVELGVFVIKNIQNIEGVVKTKSLSRLKY